MANFDEAFEIVLRHEGGYTNDPNDTGGETKYGIAKKYHPDLDIKNLTLADAKKIYQDNYWSLNNYGDIVNQEIANQAFDLAVNLGGLRANKILQQAFNFLASCAGNIDYLLAVDGKIGKMSLAEINSFESEGENAIFLIVIERLAADYYNSKGKKLYITGWLNRLFENAYLKKI